MAETKRGPGRPPGSKNKNKTSKTNTSKAKEKAQEIQAKKKADKRVIDEIWAIIAIAIGAFLAVATFTQGAGKVGEAIGLALKGVLGLWDMCYRFISLFSVCCFLQEKPATFPYRPLSICS